MYHVTGTITVVIILYLLSLFLYRAGYYTSQLHRKIWNIFLATFFILTALAGLFLALQSNYKWKLPFTEHLINWHVEIGIALAVTGFFHFIWHFKYYTGLFRHSETPGIQRTPEQPGLINAGINLFIIGFVSSSVQLLFLREMINITGGYELITGVFLASWLIISAAGSVLAGKSGLADAKRINIIFVSTPVISLFFLILLSRLFSITGQTPSFLVSFIYIFIVLLPFSLVSGFTFVRMIRFAGYSSGRSFSIETSGGIVAGIIIPLFTAGILNTFQLLLLIIILSITYVLLTYLVKSISSGYYIKTIAAILSALIVIFNADVFIRQILLPGVKITGTQDTPYGNVTTGESFGEKSTYYNHRLLTYSNDVAEREEDIHYAMLQCGRPEKVILISGSLTSHLSEILKYPVTDITYIERDPLLSKSESDISNTYNAGITISEDDAFRFIRNLRDSVDAIIMLIPPPSTLLLNRYYSAEFFEAVRKRLSRDGVFLCSPGPSQNYYNKESVRMYSSIFNSLKEAFGNVLPIAGNKLYFIASEKELSSSVTRLAIERNIENVYVGPDYLSDDLIASKTKELLSILDPGVRKNSEDFPVAFFNHQSLIFSMNEGEKTLSILIMITLFAIPVLAVNQRNLIMYSGASALAGFEIILLLTLQLSSGNMYQLTGILIAAFMSGLAAGAISDFGFERSLTLRKKGILLFLFYAFTGIIYNSIENAGNELIIISILIFLAFIPAFITGSIFREITSGENGKVNTPAIYSSDLAGSALGFIIISSLAVPLIGIRLSIFLLSLIIFTGVLTGTRRPVK